MIEELGIKDFAIIDKVILPLKEGFNVLTGETGAGKSIIVDALSILIKEKVSSTDYIKHGKTEAVVEVVLTDDFSDYESSTIILKRILSAQGKSRAYINDSVSTIQNFVKFASQYISIHGQHEHTSLLKKENHIDFLDHMAGLTDEVREFKSLYEKYQFLKKETEKLKEDLEINKQKLELYQYQLNEISEANLMEEEEKDLIEKLEILKNIFKLRQMTEESFKFLYEDKQSVYTVLSKVLSHMDSLSKIDSRTIEIKSYLDNAFAHIEEAIYLLRKIKSSYESDPDELERIEQRLTLINKLKNKYGKTIKEIVHYANELENKIKTLSLTEEEVEVKEKELSKLNAQIEEMSKKLSQSRREAAKKIEREIEEELRFLGFTSPQIKIKIEDCPLQCNGIDDVEFYFSANPGEPPKPLSKIASGGELSRLMLAFKCVEVKLVKKGLKSMTLVFDEIDSGIGGKVAENVGKRLKELATYHQVLCITHLPQIAVYGDHHLKIEKQIEDEKTKVIVRSLSEEERKREIARMLSGRITERSLFHAEELLSRK